MIWNLNKGVQLMKKCPNCNDFSLYDDNVLTCPICDSNLVTYNRNGSTSTTSTGSGTTRTREAVKPNTETQRQNTANATQQTAPEFERISGLRYHYRGIITEISSHTRLHTRLKKWVNAVFRGEPYQLGNTSHETIIRIEEFHNGRVAGRKRDLIYYGDVEGRFNHGDDVSITAKRRGDRYIVTNMYLNETESIVRPGSQIPAGIISILSLLLLVAAIYLVSGIIAFINSGALFVLLEKAITIIIVVAALWWIVHDSFKR